VWQLVRGLPPRQRAVLVLHAPTGRQIGLIDLTTVFDRPRFTTLWTGESVKGWVTGSTVLVYQGTTTLRYQLGVHGRLPYRVVGVLDGARFDPVTVLTM
jgi:hypothetical protein